ncbi:MobA/MobL family protein [Acinetobacter baumannii]|uniref:MobA/MobL family protein n=1 Tax=Acinetobacter baumannii TaxID=470 RepID=UPI0035105541
MQSVGTRGENAELKKEGDIKQEARLAKEVEVALTHELDKAQRPALVTELCQALVKAYGGPVDVAIHDPHTHGGSDERNFHAPILIPPGTATHKGQWRKVRKLHQTRPRKKARTHVEELRDAHHDRAGRE